MRVREYRSRPQLGFGGSTREECSSTTTVALDTAPDLAIASMSMFRSVVS